MLVKDNLPDRGGVRTAGAGVAFAALAQVSTTSSPEDAQPGDPPPPPLIYSRAHFSLFGYPPSSMDVTASFLSPYNGPGRFAHFPERSTDSAALVFKRLYLYNSSTYLSSRPRPFTPTQPEILDPWDVSGKK